MNDCICNEILNLNNNSTFKDARRNYLRLCLKFHPDKNHGNSKEFVKINEAYEYYINNHKKYNVISLKECMSTFQCYILFLGCFIKTKDIVLNLKIDLKDIYNVQTKKIVYSRLKHDFQFVKETLYLELSGFQFDYELEGHGDFNVSSGKYNNLNINVEIMYPDSMDIRINDTLSMYDLYYNMEINIYEYYYGVNDDLKYFNNEKIQTKGYVPHINGDILVLEDKGLMNDTNKREKLYVFFKVDMRKHVLSEEHRVTVKMLFNDEK